MRPSDASPDATAIVHNVPCQAGTKPSIEPARASSARAAAFAHSRRFALALCRRGNERKLPREIGAVAGGTGGGVGGANQFLELVAAFVAIVAVDRHGVVQFVLK